MPVTLYQRLQDDLTAAMRGRDELRRDTLRMAIAAAYNAQKQAGRDLSDEEVVAVLNREIKARREAIEGWVSAGRSETAEQEQAALEVLSAYMPAQLTESELEEAVDAGIAESGATSARELGRVMSALMPRVRGRADGKTVSAMVARKLAQRDLSGHGH